MVLGSAEENISVVYLIFVEVAPSAHFACYWVKNKYPRKLPV